MGMPRKVMNGGKRAAKVKAQQSRTPLPIPVRPSRQQQYLMAQAKARRK